MFIPTTETGKLWTKKKLKALAAELAKGLKTEADQPVFSALQIVGGENLSSPLLMELHMNPFKGRHFQRDIILGPYAGTANTASVTGAAGDNAGLIYLLWPWENGLCALRHMMKPKAGILT